MIGLIQLEYVICLITSMLYVKYQKRELTQFNNVLHLCLITSMIYVKYQKRELTQFNNVLHIVKLSYLPCLFSFFYIFHYLSYLRPFKTGWYQ